MIKLLLNNQAFFMNCKDSFLSHDPYKFYTVCYKWRTSLVKEKRR